MRQLIATLFAVLILAGAPALARGKDGDNDGIKDRKDHCPGTDISAKVAKDGCPIDEDGDGIATGIDRCSNTPAGWPVDGMGCPRDTDLDGVVDARDTCPSTPSGARADAAGCPSDSDGDRVLDGLDRCEGTPAGHTVEFHGCPTDADHDGVNDALDQCAGSAPRETVDAAGCRVKAQPLFQPGTDRILLQGLSFEKNQIEPAAGSDPILREAAASLKDWPETKVEIAVHTDKAGSAARNRELSQRRAEYVRNYLLALGVEEARMTAKGYGEKGTIGQRAVELAQVQ